MVDVPKASATVLEFPVVLVTTSAPPLVSPVLPLLVLLVPHSPRLRRAPWPFSVAIFQAAAKLVTQADSSFAKLRTAAAAGPLGLRGSPQSLFSFPQQRSRSSPNLPPARPPQ